MNSEHYMHVGARDVDRAELSLIEAPPPTRTWYPLKHADVLDTVCETLDGVGFGVESMQLSVARDNARFFGTLRLTNRVNDIASIAVGIRNSVDKSFPIGFCVGTRVFVCDNLAFRSEIVIARKHTRFGQTRFNEAVSKAVLGLHQYQVAEEERIRMLQRWELSEETANSLILQSFESSIVSVRLLPAVIREWRNPPIEDFAPRTGWSLLNCFTSALKDRQRRNPQEAALATIRLQKLLSPPGEMLPVVVDSSTDPLDGMEPE
ncbi:MAG: hypothetical protein AB7O68_14600 [Pirellulales bacterium]